MSSNLFKVSSQFGGKISFRVSAGSVVSHGSILASVKKDNVSKVIRSKTSGVVKTLHSLKNEVMIGDVIMDIELKKCGHQILMKNMCADCGLDLASIESNKPQSDASVAMVHSIPELVITTKEALRLGQADESHLLCARKLVLLVDLDQTLIHTTNENIPEDLKGVFHFRLFHNGIWQWYHTKLRPGVKHFLENISSKFELHICSFGSRVYAHEIAKILDPTSSFFSHRILSRDEFYNPTSKTGNLKALFPQGDAMVCIIDDRADVWDNAANLIQVKPYSYFKHTGDINAPLCAQKPQESTTKPVERVQTVTSSHGDGLDPLPKTYSSAILSTCSKDDAVETNAGDFNIGPANGDAESAPKVHFKLTLENGSSFSDSLAKNLCADCRKCAGEVFAQSMNNSVSVSVSNCRLAQSFVNALSSLKDESPCDDLSKLSDKQKVELFDTFYGLLTTATLPDNSQDLQQKSDRTKDPLIGDKQSSVSDDVSEAVTDENPEKSQTEGLTDTQMTILQSEDYDDYLVYLEDILSQLHSCYYSLYDSAKLKEDKTIPKMKDVVPYLRSKILRSCNIMFSGLFPLKVDPTVCDAYKLATALGASVHSSFIPRNKKHDRVGTTHLIAAKLGTAKVHEVTNSHSRTHIVTPEWLWCCSERWERVDERLFKHTRDSSSNTNGLGLNRSEKNRKRKLCDKGGAKLGFSDVKRTKIYRPVHKKTQLDTDAPNKANGKSRLDKRSDQKGSTLRLTPNSDSSSISSFSKRSSPKEERFYNTDFGKEVNLCDFQAFLTKQQSPEVSISKEDSLKPEKEPLEIRANPFLTLDSDCFAGIDKELNEIDDNNASVDVDNDDSDLDNDENDLLAHMLDDKLLEEGTELGSDSSSLRDMVLGRSPPHEDDSDSSIDSLSGDTPHGWHRKLGGSYGSRTPPEDPDDQKEVTSYYTLYEDMCISSSSSDELDLDDDDIDDGHNDDEDDDFDNYDNF